MILILGFFYDLGIRLYYGLLSIIRFYNPRAKLWFTERYENPINIPQKDARLKRIWIHCASLGEFDQALPLIKKFPTIGYEFVVSFYSPSGFKHVQNKKEYQEMIFFYLPQDYKTKMSQLIHVLKPDTIIIVKYELWKNMIFECKKMEIPLYLISSYFYNQQNYFKGILKPLYREILQCFTTIYTLDQQSKTTLIKAGIKTKIVVAKDTRVEQCFENTLRDYSNPELEEYMTTKPAIVFGSSWAKEEELALKLMSKVRHNFVVAPHNVDSQNINRLLKLFSAYSPIKLSELNNRNRLNTRLILVDSIGQLRYIYRWASIAVIGGGFSGKLHNVLEPIAYGKPVICGFKTKRFPEAQILEQKNLLIKVEDDIDQLERAVQSFNSTKNLKQISLEASKYILENKHAADKIYSEISLK